MVKPIFNKIRTVYGTCLFSLCFMLAVFLSVPVSTAEETAKTEGNSTGSAQQSRMTTKIIGGQTSKKTWPWMAALVFRGADSYNGQFCGGSLIGSEWVVTASHCTEGMSVSEIDVLIGKNSLSGSGGERIEVDRIIMHPDYDNTNWDNDIALLHLKQASSKTVLEVLYPENEDLAAANTGATILGWGKTSPHPGLIMRGRRVVPYPYDYGSPYDLREAQITIYSAAYGQQIYGSVFTDNMITAGNKNGGVDTCQGDSGGPLIVADKRGNGWLLVGITSWGIGCAAPNYPGVYAKVMNYTDWIEENTNTGIKSQDIPSAVTLTTPSGVTTDTTPAYSWEDTSNATWYELYVSGANQEVVIGEWYEASSVCTGGTCTVTPSTTLSLDSHEVFIKSWNESGSQWGSGVSFSVAGSSNLPSQITLVSSSSLISSGSTTFIWNEDSKSTWYKLYLRNTSNTNKFIQWYEIIDEYANYPETVCSSGTCSVTISATLEDDTYEWWVMGWNSYGNGDWSNGMTFSVGQ